MLTGSTKLFLGDDIEARFNQSRPTFPVDPPPGQRGGSVYAMAGQPLCCRNVRAAVCTQGAGHRAKGQCGEQGAKVIAEALGLKSYRFGWCRAEVHCLVDTLDWVAVTPLSLSGWKRMHKFNSNNAEFH